MHIHFVCLCVFKDICTFPIYTYSLCTTNSDMRDAGGLYTYIRTDVS